MAKKKSAKEVSAYTKEGIDKLQRKSFSAALSRAQIIRNQNSAKAVLKAPIRSEEKKDPSFSQQNNPDGKEPETGIRIAPASSAVIKLIDTRKSDEAGQSHCLQSCNEMEDGTGKESKCEEFPSTEDVKSRVKHRSV